jgi:hypothetical protein
MNTVFKSRLIGQLMTCRQCMELWQKLNVQLHFICELRWIEVLHVWNCSNNRKCQIIEVTCLSVR